MKIMKMMSSGNMEFLGQTKKEIQDNLLRTLVKYFYRKLAIFIRKFKGFPFPDSKIKIRSKRMLVVVLKGEGSGGGGGLSHFGYPFELVS